MSRLPGARRLVAAVVLAGTAAAAPGVAAADTAPTWGVAQSRPVPHGGAGGATSTTDAVQPAGVAASSSGTWRLSGRGWGHGVGMSQYGARQMADDGYSAAQILAHYYTGTDYSVVDDSTLISVNLEHEVTSSTMTTKPLSTGGGSFQVRVVGGDRMSGAAGASVRFAPTASGVKASCAACTPSTTLSGTTLQVIYDDGRTLLDVDGTAYRDGYVFVRKRSSAVTSMEVVGRMRLHDEYLDYIREVPWSWPHAALEAQAAAARGYALRKVAAGASAACQCHVYDTTQSQVYGGYPTGGDASSWAAWQDAVRAAGSSTSGYVATYGGRIIDSVYSSSSGGRTQNSEDVWGATVPYLRSVDDHWSLTSANPRSSWSTTRSTSTLAGAFGLSDVDRLDLSDRFVSGAVESATATSSAGDRVTLSGAGLASRLGLYSTYLQRPVSRYSGSTRYGVATSVAETRTSSADTVVVASGETAARADAAVSGPLAQALGAPLLLTRSDALPSTTRSELARRAGRLTRAVVVGGPATVSDDVVRQLQDRGLTVTRIGGVNRYVLSAHVAAKVAQLRSVSGAVVASGTALADALGAGGPAGAVGEPVLLTRADSLPTAVGDVLTDNGIRSARIVGGTTSVSDAVRTDLEKRVGTVRRTGGATRYAVAAAVGAAYAPRLGTVTAVSVASGEDAALTDALTAGSLGRITLLVSSDGVPSSTTRLLQRLPDLQRLDVIGGPVSVPSGVATTAARS